MQDQDSEPIRRQHKQEVDKIRGNFVHLNFDGKFATFQGNNGRQIHQQLCAEKRDAS